MGKRFKESIGDIFLFSAGCFIYSAATVMLIVPNKITPGGFTGIATTVNALSGISSGLLLLILNIPVLLLGFRSFGGKFILKTAVATALLSLMLSVCEKILPKIEIDRVLAAAFGGILMGVGLGIVMLRGGTTGGVDILAKYLNYRFGHLTVGRIILLIDGFVIVFAAYVYKNIESVLYSVATVYFSSVITDKVLYGADNVKSVFIVTDKRKEICEKIGSVLIRGVTAMDVTGGYTGNNRSMLFCTVRRHEVSQLLKITREVDPDAFTVVIDAGEAYGRGFKEIK